MQSRFLAIVIVLLAIVGGVAFQLGQGETPANDGQALVSDLSDKFMPTPFEEPVNLRPGHVRVVRVVDGDTIRIERGGEEVVVRLIGIDTPELMGGRTSINQPGSVEAALWMEKILGPDPQIRPEYDEERHDKYGRLLAYCWFRHKGEGPEMMLNEELVRTGLAKAKRYPPNTKYHQRLAATARSSQKPLR